MNINADHLAGAIAMIIIGALVVLIRYIKTAPAREQRELDFALCIVQAAGPAGIMCSEASIRLGIHSAIGYALYTRLMRANKVDSTGHGADTRFYAISVDQETQPRLTHN